MIRLLVVIYIAFIGLGVPDSLIGSAWPAIYPEFGLPVSYISFITLLISGCTVLSGLFSDRVLQRFGTGSVTAVSTALTAAAMLGFSLSQHFLFLVLLAIPLGFGAGAIDSGLNNYIALHYSASHMNYLHCFYGIGVSCSPYVMSLALAGNNWRGGYLSAFAIQTAITVLLILSLPLWKKKSDSATEGESKAPARTLTLGEMLRTPAIRIIWAVMIATNAIEYACGTWGSTFLVESRQFTPETGARALTLYYAGMALGRFLSGVISGKVKTWRRIGIGTGVVLLAVVMLLLPLSDSFAVAALFLVGFGNGSIYPNLMYLTPYHFGEDVSQSVMGSQIAAAYTGVMITPPLFGLVANWFGIRSFPVFLLVLFGMMSVFTFLFLQKIRQQGKFRSDV